MNRKKENKSYCSSNSHTAKKKYGQNFLGNRVLLENIIKASEVGRKDEVIEIGPGLGFLTGELIEKSKKLTAFEIDSDLIPILKKKFGNKENFFLIHEDFMKADLKKYLNETENIKVIANIPYYITSPIINKLLNYRKNISEIYLMLQKEVGERITSGPNSKNMSLLTHAVQFYADSEYLFTVPKEEFDPVPKVDSAFIKIKVLKNEKYESQISEEKYFKYLKAAFLNKRKSVGNNMSTLGHDRQKVIEALKKMNKKELTRAEEFSVQEFINFIKILEENN